MGFSTFESVWPAPQGKLMSKISESLIDMQRILAVKVAVCRRWRCTIVCRPSQLLNIFWFLILVDLSFRQNARWTSFPRHLPALPINCQNPFSAYSSMRTNLSFLFILRRNKNEPLVVAGSFCFGPFQGSVHPLSDVLYEFLNAFTFYICNPRASLLSSHNTAYFLSLWRLGCRT